MFNEKKNGFHKALAIFHVDKKFQKIMLKFDIVGTYSKFSKTLIDNCPFKVESYRTHRPREGFSFVLNLFFSLKIALISKIL